MLSYLKNITLKQVVLSIVTKTIKLISIFFNFQFFLGYRMGAVKTNFKYFFSFAYLVGGAFLHYAIYLFFGDIGVIFDKFLIHRELLVVLFSIELIQYLVGFISSILVFEGVVTPSSKIKYYIALYIITYLLIPLKVLLYTDYNLVSLFSELTFTLENASQNEKDLFNQYFISRANL